jgi:hypothetical protein
MSAPPTLDRAKTARRVLAIDAAGEPLATPRRTKSTQPGNPKEKNRSKTPAPVVEEVDGWSSDSDDLPLEDAKKDAQPVTTQKTKKAKKSAKPPKNDVYISIDCEALCISGGIFAVGASVHNVSDGKVVDTFFASCPHESLEDWRPDHPNLDWLETNVLTVLSKTGPSGVFLGQREMRDAFFHWLLKWKRAGRLAYMVADWGGIESRFMHQILHDDFEGRMKKHWRPDSPFCVLHELGTVLKFTCGDPGKSFDRLPEEQPAHHPTKDAMQSGRIWWQESQKLEAAMQAAKQTK